MKLSDEEALAGGLNYLNIGATLAAADLWFLARASSVAEIAAATPSVLVPLPLWQRDHQTITPPVVGCRSNYSGAR